MRAFTLILCSFLSVASVPPAAAQELAAVVTQLEPTVTRRQTGDEIPRTVATLDVVRQGEEIVVTSRGRVGLVCSSERWIELRGPTSWTLLPEACAKGSELHPGTYTTMVPRGGRFRTVEGILVLERSVRDQPGEALLLSPRETVVRSARPQIQWRFIADAVEYEITLTGLAKPVRVRAGDARCQAEPEWDGVNVCAVPWPEAHPGLQPGSTVFLNVGYRTGLASPLHQEDETGSGRWIARLGEAAESKLAGRLAALESLGWPEATRALLTAGIYAERRLFADALATYRQVLEPGREAIEVTLGDLYSKVGLFRFAFLHYQTVLDKEHDPTLRAAASFGIGRLYAGMPKGRARANEYFKKAENLFAGAGLEEEKTAAEKAAAATRSSQF